MKIFLDTANISELKDALSYHIVDGVTTNPTLLAKEQAPEQEILTAMTKLLKGPVSAEVLSLTRDGMVEEGKRLFQIHSNIVVKIPATYPGLQAMAELKELGIPTNATLIFSPLQGYLSMKAGAAYISPFIGRLNDIGQDGMETLIKDLLIIKKNYGYTAEIIGASIRTVKDVLDALRLGLDIVTVPHAIFKSLMNHPMTDQGMERFLQDAKRKGLPS